MTFQQNSSNSSKHSDSTKEDLLVFPYPKVFQRLPGEVMLSAPLNILVSKNDVSLVAVKVLRSELYKRFRVASDLQMIEGFDSSGQECVIMLILNQKGELDKLLKAMQIKLPDKDIEGTFVLSARANRVVIAARDVAGLLYGVYDLLQLVEVRNHILQVPGLKIEDWPTLKMRGFTIDPTQCLGVQKMEFYYALIDRLAVVRANNIFANLADGTWFCMEMPNRPALSQPRAHYRDQDVTDFHPFTEQQLRDLVVYAHQRGIEIVPMIDSIGHARVYTDIYPDLADPGSVRGKESTLDPFNPGTEYLLDDIYEFCAKIFPSPFMHVAGDEVESIGNSEGARQSYEKADAAARGYSLYEWAYKHQIETINELVKKYGRKQIIKTDMLLERRNILDAIPKNVILDVNNRYEPRVDPAEPEFLLNKGFKVMGCASLIRHRVNLMPSTANIANVTQWTKIAQNLSLIGVRVCLWNPERVIDDATWLSCAYAGALMWEGTPEAKAGGTFKQDRLFKAYTKFNFGLPADGEVPKAFLVLQNNAPKLELLNKILISDPETFRTTIQGELKSERVADYVNKVNDPTGQRCISAVSSVVDYINKVNDELPVVVKSLEQYRGMVKYNLQEYDGLLLASRIERFLGTVGKLYVNKRSWPLDAKVKEAVRKITRENDQLLGDIIVARDHWRYEDNPGRAGKPQGWGRKTWLLHFFYDFQKQLGASRAEYC